MGVFNAHKVVGHLPALMRYARSLTRDATAAEDLVHDTLVAAYASSASFDRRQSLRVWLFAILRNHFISDRRKIAVRQRNQDDLETLAPTLAEPPQEQALHLHQIAQAFAALPVEQREALHIVVVEGLSYHDAAAALGIPVGTLMSRIARARARLRQGNGDEAHSDERDGGGDRAAEEADDVERSREQVRLRLVRD